MAADYFFEARPLELQGKGAHICLLLDFDGTLVPIRNDPDACVLSPDVKGELRALAGSGACSVAIVSGRSLPDIEKRVKMDGIYLSGNHGLVISGPDLNFVHPEASRAKDLIEGVRRTLEKEISSMEGAWIEDKGLSFTLHYRQVRKEMSPSVRKTFFRVLSGVLHGERLKVVKGKKVLELTPDVKWDKGEAALFIIKAMGNGSVPVFVGDDLTDETAFRALREKGITVRVGRSGKTSARYYLKGQWEVLRFLREIGERLHTCGRGQGCRAAAGRVP